MFYLLFIATASLSGQIPVQRLVYQNPPWILATPGPTLIAEAVGSQDSIIPVHITGGNATQSNVILTVGLKVVHI